VADEKKKETKAKAKAKPKAKAEKKPEAKAKKPAKKTAAVKEYQPNLLQLYSEKVMPALQKQLGVKNSLEVPRVLKISLNVGIGNAREEKAALEHALADLMTITGQKAVVTRAKKAISNFKLRIGDPVGARVTLRRWHMYEFLERLINIALPRVRDFSGLSAKSFDGRGNFSFGIQEQIVFPEIDYDKIDKIRGLDVTITTSARTDEEAYHLLKLMGFPFRLDNRYERATSAVEEEQLEEVTDG
jgi:large subunit ribosomal protein L5